MLQLVETIRSRYFAFPPAEIVALRDTAERGVPPALLDFYALCDGALIADGQDFSAPDGRRFRLAVPRLRKLQTVQECGFILDDSPLYCASAHWWQVLDYGDSNWLALDATQEGHGRILDIFHETVGTVEYHSVVADSFSEMLERVLAKPGVYWLAEDFEPNGYV